MRSHEQIQYVSPYQKAMKNQSPKRPRGRQPIGAVLVDGKWQMTELAVRLAAERLLRVRENARIYNRKTRELLRLARPELFPTKGLHPRQTTLAPRSPEPEVHRAPCRKTDDTSYDAFWRSVQRDEADLSTNSACTRKGDE